MSLTAYQMANIYMIPAQGTENLLDTIRTASQNAAAERACDVRPFNISKSIVSLIHQGNIVNNYRIHVRRLHSMVTCRPVTRAHIRKHAQSHDVMTHVYIAIC